MRKKPANTYNKYLKIKDRSEEDRPREKLINQGAKALSNAELLGLIIGSGIQNMNSIDLARQILQSSKNDLKALARLSVEQLQLFKGIGKAKAALIAGVLELGTRLQKRTKNAKIIIKSAKAAYQFIKPKLSHKTVEEFWVILLNCNNEVIKASRISTGGLTRTTVDKAVLFKQCLLNDASYIILVHNHPSGNPAPSTADIKLTKRIVEASKLFQVTIFDHIIFCENDKYFSFADEGINPDGLV